MHITEPITPQPIDTCSRAAIDPAYARPTATQTQFIEPDEEGRLRKDLRNVAAQRSAFESLTRAAIARFLVAHPQAGPAYSGGLEMIGTSSVEYANALADLAVTGRHSVGTYRQTNPGTLRAEIASRLAQIAAQHPATSSYHADTLAGIAADPVLQRAEQVLKAIAGTPSQRAALRGPLGWIAVSAEDDTPHRPVNVPTGSFPQFDVDITVKGIPVTVRYMIASLSQPDAATPIIPPNERVLLFIHGHGSRLEECSDMVHALLNESHTRGMPCTLISLDLPNCGYNSYFDSNHLGPVDSSQRYTSPALDFHDEFILEFVRVLDASWHFANRIECVMGGSLGGAMGLRLGRMAPSRIPWRKHIVAWSAGSVWDAMADDAFKGLGPNHLRGEAKKAEAPDSRKGYFSDNFEGRVPFAKGPLDIPGTPIPDMWYRDDWSCKPIYLQEDRLDRQEIYSPWFRVWDYRVALEILIFSFKDPDTQGGHPPRYADVTANLLFAAGEKDNYNFANIYDATRTLAALMTHTPGTTLFLEETGHSIHNERPNFFAKQITEFIVPVAAVQPLIDVSGNPLVRFTGQVHDWSHAVPNLAAFAGRPVVKMTLTIATGGDDLRGGHNAGDNCTATLHLTNGQQLVFGNINQGGRWADNSSHTVDLPIPSSVTAGQIASLSLHTGFGGGIGGDNWNVNRVHLVMSIGAAMAAHG